MIVVVAVAGCARGRGRPAREYSDPLGRKLLRLKYLGAITGTPALRTESEFNRRIGPDGSLLSAPLAVELGTDGTVFVADQPNSRIEAFDPDNGKFLFQFNVTTPGRILDVPAYLAVNPINGNVFVSDWGYKSLYEFTPKGRFVREIPPPAKIGRDWAPTAITFDSRGNLYVVNVVPKHQVIVFDGTSKVRKVFGDTGVAKYPRDKLGKLWYPAGIAVVSNGWVFVSDSQNRRLQLFDENGKFQRMIFVGGNPRGLAVAPNNLIILADAHNHYFAIYTPEGKILKTYGTEGYKAAQFADPNDAAIDPKTARVFVTDPDNNRVQVWQGQ